MGQCLTSSKAETSKKIFSLNKGLAGQSRGCNELFCSNVVGRPVKLACYFKRNTLIRKSRLKTTSKIRTSQENSPAEIQRIR